MAVSIAAGTKRNPRATNGGISKCANSAMNDSRDRKLSAPTTRMTVHHSIAEVIGAPLAALRPSWRAPPRFGEHSRRDADDSGADQRQPHGQGVERHDRYSRRKRGDASGTILQRRDEECQETERDDELERPRDGNDIATQ
jgi:hypothetical protein